MIYNFSLNYFGGEPYYFEKTESLTGDEKDRLDFSAPMPPRYTVSRRRYLIWFWVFFILVFMLFIILWWALKSIQPITLKDSPLPKDISVQIYSMFPQFLAALTITGFLPALSPVVNPLKYIREFCHGYALIPRQAQVAYEQIVRQKLDVDEGERKRAIKYASDSLREIDFEAAAGTFYHHWSSSCHLMNVVEELSRNLESSYAETRAAPELRYKLVNKNFRQLRADVAVARTAGGPSQGLAIQVERFFAQVAQLTVALVFASEARDRDVYRTLNKIGVSLSASYGYEVRLSPVFIASFLNLVVTFVVAYVATAFVQLPEPKPPGEFAGNTAIVCTIFFSVAAYLAFDGKKFMARTWPVRGQFSSRQRPPLILAWLIGTLVGVATLYAMSMVEVLGMEAGGTRRRLPYGILLGMLCAMFVLAADGRPKPMSGVALASSTTMFATVGSLSFVLVTMCVTVYVNDIPARSWLQGAIWAEHSWLLLVVGVLGALGGALGCMLSWLCIQPAGEQDFLRINLSQYLVPILDPENIREHDRNSLSKVLVARSEEIRPGSFWDYLQHEKVVDQDGLTEKGFNALKRIAG